MKSDIFQLFNRKRKNEYRLERELESEMLRKLECVDEEEKSSK